MLRKVIAGLVAAGFATVLFGADLAAKPKPRTGADEPNKVFDFEGDTIETDFLKPDAAMVESIVREKKHSLIKIRTDFIDEIVKSVEDL